VKRIRLLFLTGSLNLGGTERNLLHLASALDRRRYEPAVWCIYRGHALQAEIERRGVPVRTFRDPSLGAPPARRFVENVRFQWRLWRALLRHRPDVLHIFGFPTAYYGVLLGRLAGVRRILFAVQDWDVWKGRSRLYRWLDSICSRLASRVIADGAGARRLAVQRQAMPPAKVTVIYDGVNAAEMTPSRPREGVLRDLGLDPARPVAGVVARLDVRKKGQDVFIAAIPAVCARCPQAQFLIVGDGPDGDGLRARARRLPPGQRPVFAGTRRDLADILAALDAVVIPSRWESVPKVLLEAMYLGRAVVAARVGDIGEILDETCGRLVPPDAPRALADAVVRLLLDEGLRLRLGRAARARIEARGLTLDRSAKRYDRMYRRLAAGNLREGVEAPS